MTMREALRNSLYCTVIMNYGFIMFLDSHPVSSCVLNDTKPLDEIHYYLS